MDPPVRNAPPGDRIRGRESLGEPGCRVRKGHSQFRAVDRERGRISETSAHR